MWNKRTSRAGAALTATCLALSPACSTQESDDLGPESTPLEEDRADYDPAEDLEGIDDPLAAEQGFDLGDLDFIPPEEIAQTFIQRLAEPTDLGEDTAIHVRIASAADEKGEVELLKVFGGEDAPVLFFKTDTLVQIGVLSDSPGPDFFTTFADLDEATLEARAQHEAAVEKDGASETSLVFRGRHVVGLTLPTKIDIGAFFDGKLVDLGTTKLMPPSIPANWNEAVMVTDPEVVTDPDRTVDPCTHEGNACGPWTFCHLMTEMANEPLTGITPEKFAQQWLEQWLDDYTVNSDTVAERDMMLDMVIKPWIKASGGKLDLKRAPFRLLAIVNRLDLRHNSAGGSGYSGGGKGDPLDAGELRFVFGVVSPVAGEYGGKPGECNSLPFTVIFEYGVPITGCKEVIDWAQQWVALDTMGGFGPAYRAALEALTEQVVLRDLAPAKGNRNAINQIRTNEIALTSPWELREFTLNDQSFACDSFVDVPSDGFLRPHTTLQTPDDAVHSPTTNALVDAFVNLDVLSTVPPLATLADCTAAHTVPVNYDCASSSPEPFLGANALVKGGHGTFPGHWQAKPWGPASNEFMCARHEFSLNTCHGCHRDDTNTGFTHVDPTSGIPAALSGFLTGIVVPDPQFPAENWTFADLARRYQDLYDVAGDVCGDVKFVKKGALKKFGGKVVDPDTLAKIFASRAEFTEKEASLDPVLDDVGQPAPNFSH